MNIVEQRRLINQDLYNELRYLLISATIWQACREREHGGDTSRIGNEAHHLQAIAMDSACVHARALYEFFFSANDAETASAKRDFGVNLTRTPLYADYWDTLNKRLFHIDLKRPKPTNRQGATPIRRNLNRKPKAFAADILQLWDEFSIELPDLHRQLSGARRKAISEADKAAISVKGRVVFE